MAYNGAYSITCVGMFNQWAIARRSGKTSYFVFTCCVTQRSAMETKEWSFSWAT